MEVGVNNFVRRQVEGSGKTYSKELSFEFFARHAKEKLHKDDFKDGYRDGVRIIKLDDNYIKKVFCPYVRITNKTKLKANQVSRRPSEEPYIQVRALNGTPLEAGSVSLILYRHDVLAENSENTTDADWELISINALPKGVETMPIGPVTMMRNQLELEGGTKATYTSEEWAKSVQFWQKYAAIEPSYI